jgi:hypothetical protein
MNEAVVRAHPERWNKASRLDSTVTDWRIWVRSFVRHDFLHTLGSLGLSARASHQIGSWSCNRHKHPIIRNYG